MNNGVVVSRQMHLSTTIETDVLFFFEGGRAELTYAGVDDV